MSKQVEAYSRLRKHLQLYCAIPLLEAADIMKKRLYLEASGRGGKTFEIYRQMVLLDQFERAHRLAAAVSPDSKKS